MDTNRYHRRPRVIPITRDGLIQAIKAIKTADGSKLHPSEIRWRLFIIALDKCLCLDPTPQEDTLAAWIPPANLTEQELTLFELLQYPNLFGLHPKEAKLREVARQIYAYHRRPQLLEPISEQECLRFAAQMVPALFRKVLTHNDVRANNINGRWEAQNGTYSGTFSHNQFTARSRTGEICNLTFNQATGQFQGETNPWALLEFCEAMDFSEARDLRI